MHFSALLSASLPLLAVAFPAEKRTISSQTFTPPGPAPDQFSPNYVGKNNGTLNNGIKIPGRAFDRVFQIWLENTNFADASSQAAFQALQKQGILLDAYHSLGHPSEPNYLASVYGDRFGLGDDTFSWVPQNTTNVFDLLDTKFISWACYQENLPSDGFQDFSYTQKAYVPGGTNYTYYVRKHNPCAFPEESQPQVSTARANRNRNFNDFAADLNASALPQWAFFTPNMIDDAHDTGVNYAASWLQYWLVPLLANKKFNDGRTLIILTFDENQNYAIENEVYTLLLGDVLPANLKGTTDSTFYSHYSTISTVEANWGLPNLGRGDVIPVLNNVFSWVASLTGFKNVANTTTYMLNGVGNECGPLNDVNFQNFVAPNKTVIGPGGQLTHYKVGANPLLTSAQAPACTNKTTAFNNPYHNQTYEQTVSNPNKLLVFQPI
ncbi:hypothetical protein CBS101457_002920 [Exobasidium rhododendri]|nr:hypothetical protein CBS101457_002920 [Exobasidium rhododendri]